MAQAALGGPVAADLHSRPPACRASLGRHDMVFLSAAGLAAARTAARRRNPALTVSEAGAWLAEGIPAIITRQRRRHKDGCWEAGFSLPQHVDGVRLRFRTLIDAREISSVATPFAVAACAASALSATLSAAQRAVLADITALAAANGLQAGVYGSLALQALTGLAYFNENSDYDIFVRKAAQAPDVASFHKGIGALESRHGARIDVEIACLEDSGAKLAELFCSQRTVLCKGLYGVKLCPREALALR